MPITISITGRSGTISDFIGGLCSEKLIFIGESLTLPAKVALIDLDGTTLAAADLQSNDTGAVFANLSTDTQQVADRYRYQPPDTLNRATLFVGDDTTLQAVIEVQVKKNWLDDTAYHPPVAPNIYPTEAELETWLAQAKKIGEQIQEVSGPALESAKKAEQAATRASQYASDAAGSSISAAKSYENAEASRAGAESAAQVARDARENAQLQQQQATAAAGKANGYRQQAANSQRLAERAQEKAEAAQQAAEEAQSAADGFASDAAQSAQEAAAKADEASQAAADAGSAKTAAQAAKTAAETAKTQAEAARDAANTAKSGAEKAKQDAEAAKAAAATSASQAATSATNAAQSADAAKEAAEGLQEGLDTLNALDGRVTLLETGEGVYKDPKTGKVKTFTPFEKCADGTLQVLGDGGFFKRIAPVEVGATEVCSPIGDGTFLGFIKGGGDYYADTQVFGYNGAIKRIFRVKIPGMGGGFSDQGYRCANAQFAVWTGTDGVRRAACPDKGGGRLYLFEMPDAELVTQYVKSVAAPTGWVAATVWYNEQSGHLNALCKTDAEGFFVVAWDTELNPILGEDGAQRHVPAPDWATYNHGRSSLNVIRTYGRTFVWDTGWSAWGGSNSNFALFASTAEDGLEPVHEHIPLPDPDAPSICKRTVDAEGNIVIDDPSVNATRPRLETEDVGVLKFCAQQPERRKLPSGATNGTPAFALRHDIVLFSDGVNVYWLTKDGRFINTCYCVLRNVAQPGYKGNNPTPVTAPWPPAKGDFPVVAVGVFGDCNALVYAKTAEWSTFKHAVQYAGQQHDAFAKLTRWAPYRFFSVAPVTSGANAKRLGALFGRKYAYYVDYDYLAQSGGTMGGYVQ